MKVTSGLFPLLGVEPLCGRAVHASRTTPTGSPQVVLLADTLWQKLFDRDPKARSERRLRLDGSSYEIIGVMPSNLDAHVFSSSRDLGSTRRLTPDSADRKVSLVRRAITMLARLRRRHHRRSGPRRNAGRRCAIQRAPTPSSASKSVPSPKKKPETCASLSISCWAPCSSFSLIAELRMSPIFCSVAICNSPSGNRHAHEFGRASFAT